MLTIMSLHASPWVGAPNTAFTFGDKNGIDWIFEYQNAEIPVVKETESNYKYADYYFETTDTNNYHFVIEYTQIIPSHFGYNTNVTLGDSFAYLPDRHLNMMTTEMMRLTPNAVPEDRRSLLKSYTDTDFIRLINDPTVSLVYANNKFDVWNIALP